MKLHEVMKYCANGEYLKGTAFINELEEVLYFDGNKLHGAGSVSVNSTWEHSDDYRERKANEGGVTV